MSDTREQFEYCSEMVPHDRVIARANELGLSGWEMVGVYPVALHVHGPFSHAQETKFECIFKRKVLKQNLLLSMATGEHGTDCQCGYHPKGESCAGPDVCGEPGHGHPVG